MYVVPLPWGTGAWVRCVRLPWAVTLVLLGRAWTFTIDAHQRGERSKLVPVWSKKSVKAGIQWCAALIEANGANGSSHVVPVKPSSLDL